MEDLNVNFWNLLILMGIIQGIIFGIIVLFNKKYSSRTNSYLAYTAFSLSFSNLQYWFIDSNLTNKLPFLFWFRIPTEFLIIPMFYIFVKSYLDINTGKKIKLLLVLPFFIDTFLQLILFTDQSLLKMKILSDDIIENYLLIEELFSFVYSLFLILVTLKIVKSFEERNKMFKIDFVKQRTKWLRQILLIGFTACIVWICEIYIVKNIFTDEKNCNTAMSIYYPIWIMISIIIYWLSYVGLFQSNLHIERKELRNKMISEKNDYSISSEIVQKKFNGETHERILSEFKVIVKKNYMNPDLTLADVAGLLNISSNYLSQIINSNKISFKDYTNSIRVENVKKNLNDVAFENYTITSIGLECGFNSNASFYRAFKKHTGLSPSEFKNN